MPRMDTNHPRGKHYLHYLPGEGKIAAIKRIRSTAPIHLGLAEAKAIVDSWGEPPAVAVSRLLGSSPLSHQWGSPVQAVYEYGGAVQTTEFRNNTSAAITWSDPARDPLHPPFVPSVGLQRGDVKVGDRVRMEWGPVSASLFVEGPVTSAHGDVVEIKLGSTSFSTSLPYVRLLAAVDGRDISQFYPINSIDSDDALVNELASTARQYRASYEDLELRHRELYVKLEDAKAQHALEYQRVCDERDSLAADLREAFQ